MVRKFVKIFFRILYIAQKKFAEKRFFRACTHDLLLREQKKDFRKKDF